ncbi:ABC transporter substrate-binding protein [Ruminococcaceae bacterium OttesenSCG-928-O06]|nr:ABC transporter substrate-binding protein [Ruminococcaceae bacterium OttesenSCG-928-O06]
MKKLLTLMLAALLVFSFVACGGGNGGTSGATSGSDASGSDAGGETQVVLGLVADYFTFDPAYVYEKTAHMIMPVLYDTLVKFDENATGGIAPNFASEWTISDDNLTYVFTLREDVVATTGKTLNAADVEFCLNRMINLGDNPSELAKDVESVVATGDFEVTLTLKEVSPAILSKMAETAFGVYDSEAAQENGATGDAATDTAQSFFDGQSIGSGPYILDSFVPNEQLVLKKNPNYWGTPANVDTIILKHINDPSMQMMSLERGDIDIAFDLTAVQIESLDESNVSVYTFPTLDIFFFSMNMDPTVGGPFADQKVREAVYYALDYEGLCEIAGNGAKTPYNIIQNGFAGYLGESPITRDLDKARELLAEAGYADGFTFECGVIPDMAPSGVAFMDCAVKIKADLEEIGLVMEIAPDEVSIYLDKMRGAQYQTCRNMWGPDYADPDNQLSFMPGQNSGLRNSWTTDMAPELAELCTQAQQETDPEAREALFEEIQRQYTEAAGPALVFLQVYRALPCSTRLANVEYTATQMVNLAALSVQ